jgi:hypothetical protein
MSMNVPKMPTPKFGDVQGSSLQALTTQQKMLDIQRIFKVKQAKLKTMSAIAKSMTASMEEMSRRMA